MSPSPAGRLIDADGALTFDAQGRSALTAHQAGLTGAFVAVAAFTETSHALIGSALRVLGARRAFAACLIELLTGLLHHLNGLGEAVFQFSNAEIPKHASVLR